MGVIAGVSHNVVIGCIFGSFSVMLASVEARMGVSAEQAALGIPLVVLSSSLSSLVVGIAANRISLRLILLGGALLSLAGYLLLAFTTSYPVYLLVHALLFGPSMAMGGSVGPATLVTRWFTRNRGLALGLVHLSVVVTIVPILTQRIGDGYSAQAAYLVLAAMVGLILLPMTLFVRDNPPGAEPGVAAAGGSASSVLTLGQILRHPKFWLLSLAGSSVSTGAVALGTLMLPLSESFGIAREKGAILAAAMSFVAMAGSVLFGWVADRIGGARGIAVVATICAVFWAMLLLKPGFPMMLVTVGVLGMCGAGMIPNLARGLAEIFGPDGFSRAFGFGTTVGLPFTILAVVGSARVYTVTGSYAPAIAAMVALFVIAVPLALLAARK
jgi:nitrate/nitrite transporter NarK